MNILVLQDDRTGHNKQSIAVAEELSKILLENNSSPNIIYQTISYNFLAKLPSLILNLFPNIFYTRKDKNIINIDVIIATGRRLAIIANNLKKKSNNKIIICQMMLPDGNLDDFDLLAIPHHDDISKRKINTKKLVRTIGAPHNITIQKLNELSVEKAADIQNITLLIGGDTKKSKFTDKMAGKLIAEINKITQDKNVQLLVSVSRRTPDNIINKFRKSLNQIAEFYNPIDSSDNPYLKYLAMADVLVVAGDSISMCVESCGAGKPVYIYNIDELVPEKHKKLHQELYQNNYAKPLENFSYEQQNIPQNTTLNEAKKIASILYKNCLA